MDITTVTPYSTVNELTAQAMPSWVSGQDAERVAAYTEYEKMYWNITGAFEIYRRPLDGSPIYVPNPKTIANTTSYYLLKGLQLTFEDPEKSDALNKLLTSFLKRERFYSKFQIAKHAGIVRGDWVMHVTADPTKPVGKRVSICSCDPATYFPVYNEDDQDEITGVRLVEQYSMDDDPTKTRLKILEYGYTPEGRVWRTENIWEVEGWNNPKRAQKIKELLPIAVLPPAISQIPVYHFKNAEWDGFQFGTSEFKGVEKLFSSVNQQVSDTDLALSLVGLGVYATDASRPINESNGLEIDWEVTPGRVLEVPGATMFKRLEGISTVTPAYDHIEYLEKKLFEATGTSEVALGHVDTQTAESGIALAIRFIPTLAKIEYRDESAIETLTQMFYDLKSWWGEYENWDFGDTDILVKIGEKLPTNRAKLVEELNNMKDRNVISAKYYRGKMTELGYKFPDNEEQQILDEMEKALDVSKDKQLETAAGLAAQAAGAAGGKVPGPGGRLQGAGDTMPANMQSKSNNASSGKVNESKGTEMMPGKNN